MLLIPPFAVTVARMMMSRSPSSEIEPPAVCRPSFRTKSAAAPFASSSSVPAPPTVTAFATAPTLSTVIVPFVVRSEAFPPPDCDRLTTVTASDSVRSMWPLVVLVTSSEATVVSMALVEPTPVAALMTSRPLAAMTSTALFVSASSTAPPALRSTALLLLLVVTSCPSVMSPPAFKSISPEPAFKTVTIVLSSVITIAPPVIAPALTSISPVVVVTSAAAVKVTLFRSEVSVTCPSMAVIVFCRIRFPLLSLAESPANSVIVPEPVVLTAPD